ncbi:hypothetical protein ElyMa_002016900 [Elysia marginata]|uniref:Uncharacterized protein n=1 Tax=Elysia marginata TaxID=1093978 RepID=A0AAV4F663_9GAST|nr:hypothetical protein ElyMa_002016900 [Elysia marginata]
MLSRSQFSRAQWKASADEDDKGRLGVITSRNGPEWQCINWSGQPQTEMHGDRKLILLPSDPPDDPTGRGTDHDDRDLRWFYDDRIWRIRKSQVYHVNFNSASDA